jgi:hypothetical protein
MSGANGLPDLSRTEATLEAYEALDRGLRALSIDDLKATPDEDLDLAWDIRDVAYAAVQEAYVLDTADRNSPDRARLVGPDFARRMVDLWRRG